MKICIIFDIAFFFILFYLIDWVSHPPLRIFCGKAYISFSYWGETLIQITEQREEIGWNVYFGLKLYYKKNVKSKRKNQNRLSVNKRYNKKYKNIEGCTNIMKWAIENKIVDSWPCFKTSERCKNQLFLQCCPSQRQYCNTDDTYQKLWKKAQQDHYYFLSLCPSTKFDPSAQGQVRLLVSQKCTFLLVQISN